MEKIYGTSQRQDCLRRTGRTKWVLFYGFGRDDESSETGWEYRHIFDHKPTLPEVKTVIISAINAATDDKILRGFVWRDEPVWLSTENQFNYKAAYDLAVQTNGASLPVKFKFGTDNAPAYHTFDNIDELRDFYSRAVAHVQQALDAGWEEKDNVNWGSFEL